MISNRAAAQDIPKRELKQLRYLFRYLAPYKGTLILAFIGLLVSSGSVLSMGLGLRYLIDNGLASHDQAALNNIFLYLLSIITVLALATFARFYFITKAGERVVADIRNDIYQHLLGLSQSFFDKTKTGELVSRITTDTTFLQFVVSSSLSVALRNSIMLIGGLGLLIHTNPKLTIIIVVLVPVVLVPVLILGKKVRHLSKESQSKVADVASHIEETVSLVRTVQAYGQEQAETTRFDHKVNDAYSMALQRVFARGLLTAIVIFLVFTAVGIILWIGSYDLLAGDITAGELSSFLFYSLIVATAFGALSEVFGDMQRAAGAAERLFELLSLQSDVKEPQKPVTLPQTSSPPLSFENVQFRYPTRTEIAALDDVSFNINAGEQVAIVGESGAGKSTLFQLLLRYYDVTSGSIRIDDILINQLNLAHLRAQFSYVSQEIPIFATSLRDNISYGAPHASEDEVMQAAKDASVDAFVSRLPEGYETIVGERGQTLSGGERQRIAIARAILKNAPILLLDEATNALDRETERIVQDALIRLSKGRTTLIIAHRFSTVQHVDRIIVMHEGRIDAIGTHDELMDISEVYQTLAGALQSH